MKIRITRRKRGTRRYECFDCGVTLDGVLFSLDRCPSCDAEDEFHQMS